MNIHRRDVGLLQLTQFDCNEDPTKVYHKVCGRHLSDVSEQRKRLSGASPSAGWISITSASQACYDTSSVRVMGALERNEVA